MPRFYTHYSSFLTKRISANPENTAYRIGPEGTTVFTDDIPEILWQDYVLFDDNDRWWTFGKLHNDNKNIDIDIDNELNAESNNAIANKAVTKALNTKFAGIAFRDGVLYLYADEAKTQLIQEIPLGAVSYVLSVAFSEESGFYVLTSEDSHIVTITPSTMSSAFGTQNNFVENYNVKVEFKRGTSDYDTIFEGLVQNGKSVDVDVRPLASIGNNAIRVTATGMASGTVVVVDYACILTNLTFSCDMSWEKAWVGGTDFVVDNIYFYGNLAKTLYVRIDGDDSKKYAQSFSASANYNNSPYSFPIASHWKNITTGIHTVEIWIEGGGTSSKVVSRNVMVVESKDASSAQLVVMNEMRDKAKNYNSETSLFKFATYNTSVVHASVVANDGQATWEIMDDDMGGIVTQTRNDFPISLAIDSYVQTEDFVLDVALSVDGGNQSEHTFIVDNSESYAPTAGADVYFNFASRNNASANRTDLINEAENPNTKVYTGIFTDFAWNNDGYTTDADGNMCLMVSAGSTVEVPDFHPLLPYQSSSMSFEFMFRASAVADYNTPVLSVMSTDEYDADTTTGLILFPTQIKVLSSSERRHTFQSYNLSEDDIMHVVVVWHKNYAGTGNNMCRVYVNSCPVIHFEFSGTATFGNGMLRMGQPSANAYFYMMRLYSKVLEPEDINANFLNALIENNEYSRKGLREDNAIMDGGSISYDLAKQRGFNCYVIETDEEIPSFDHQTELSSVNVRLEYADYPEWSVRICDIPMDGQGTTSKKYPKWNLRNNNKNASARWEYLGLTNDAGEMLVEIGKDGYIAGYGLHPKVSKITAKKNTASSSQGHKMGATAMYNELWHMFFDGIMDSTQLLPSKETRVAVYQQPFLGFKQTSDGGYEFIGLYTIGPDKTDKKTFGYDKTVDYPSLMMIEGPNHAPRMTRFLHPWVDVAYDPAEETLTCGGEEGWDADIASGYSTDKEADRQNILNLYTSEFKPAYDLIYFTSPYIRSLASTGKTIAQINADIDGWMIGKTNGLNNNLLSLYDGSYNLYYYSNKEGKYVMLDGHNVRTYLGISKTNPSEEEIQAACAAKFRSEISNYVNIDEALFHRVFTILIGASDNDAKNTYWRKFKTLANGGRWGFNQDDLDTILPSDNNGQSTKSYSIEPGDLTDNGDEIFQGQTSAFWMRLNLSYASEIRATMTEMIGYLVQLAAKYKVSGKTTQASVFNMFEYYFWRNSSKYFPAIAYAEDTEFTYIDAWVADHLKTYNNVEPLTQALGTQFNAEKIWVERRIAYIFSKYRIGGFRSTDNDYGFIAFTPSTRNEAIFRVKPAIDLYPRESRGGAEPLQGERTRAGEICEIVPSSDGATTFYLLGLNWYTEIGDLSRLVLTSRGGSSDTAISFEVSAKRLRILKVGDADASAVLFNATTLNVSGDALEYLDARNAAHLQGNIDLSQCPRLRTALFAGTKATLIILPIGAKTKQLSLPDTTTTLFLYSLPLLRTENIEISGYSKIVSLYINNCKEIDPIPFLRSILNTANNELKYVTLIWSSLAVGQSTDISLISELADSTFDAATGEGYGSVVYNPSNGSLTNVGDKPIIEGSMRVAEYAYRDELDKIKSVFPNLTISGILGYYIRFADPKVLDVILANGVGSANGVTEAQAQAVRSMVISGTSYPWFRENKEITSFNEFKYFTGLSSFPERLFSGCTNLRSVTLPLTNIGGYNYMFDGCTSLEDVTIPEGITTRSMHFTFRGCTALKTIHLPSTLPALGNSMFYGCTNLDFELPRTVTALSQSCLQNSGIRHGRYLASTLKTSGANYIYYQCARLETMEFEEGVTYISQSTFRDCPNLVITSLPDTIEEIDHNAFDKCEKLAISTLPSHLITLGNYAFNQTAITITSMANVTKVGGGAFRNCKQLNIDAIPAAITDIPDELFRYANSLTMQTLHNGIKTIGVAAFESTKVEFSSWPTAFNQDELKSFTFANTNVSFSSIPSCIKHIGQQALYGCKRLTTLYLQDTITQIDEGAFGGCENLKITHLPSGLTEIATRVFNNGVDLTAITNLPNGIKRIGLGAFQGCKGIGFTTLPTNLERIEESAFIALSTATFTSLPTTVNYIGTSAFQNSNAAFDIPANVTYLGYAACSGYKYTGVVHLGSKLEYLGQYAFQSATITGLIMSRSSVTTIPQRFCFGAYNIETIDLPNNISVIESEAFDNPGTKATKVIMRSTTPPTGGAGGNYFSRYAKIYVPAASLAAYQASVWNQWELNTIESM